MKPHYILYLLFLVSTVTLQAQAPEVKTYEKFDMFLAEQNEKVTQIKIGTPIEDVEAIMGGSIRVQVPKVGRMKPLDKTFKQPEYRNVFKPNTDNEVIVLWYFTTPKDQNGYVSKSECTPVLLIGNKVEGIGWEFFNQARKNGTLR